MDIQEMQGALDGVRVLDLSRLLPGPYCSMMLADLGAEVIKIEEPGRGDYLRYFPPRVNKESAMFLAVNRNKKSVTLNLKSEQGKKLFLELAKNSDIVLEGFRPGVMKNLGLGYEEVKSVNPGIIYCSISGYGQDGPYAKRAGHDINYLAAAGVLGITGSRDGRPALPGVQVGDIGGGSMTAAFSIVTALFSRERTGKGQYIDVSMTDGVMSWLSMHAGKYFADGQVPEPGGELLNGGVPCYNIYRTKDGRYMALGALEEGFWEAFCKAVDREDLVDKQFSTGEKGRMVIEEVEKIFASRNRDEWVEFLKNTDCCCEPVADFKETFGHLQVNYRQMVQEMEHPTEGKVNMLNFPGKLSGTPAKMCTPPPGLGEHNKEILKSLGYSEEELKKLKEEKIL